MIKNQKLKIKKKKKLLCRNPGLNRGHLDLQSNALPTELFRLATDAVDKSIDNVDFNIYIYRF